MRSPALHLSMLSLILLLCAGCGNPHTARSVSEFEHNHPYAKLDNATAFTSGPNYLTYRDRFPRISEDGRYESEGRIYMLTVQPDGKTVTSVAWGVTP